MKTNKRSIGLSDADLHTLHLARMELRNAWQDLILTPPPSHAPGRKRAGTAPQRKCTRDSRVMEWKAHFASGAHLNVSDPFTYIDTLKARRHLLAPKWCDSCLKERENAWDIARVQWWSMLGKILPTE